MIQRNGWSLLFHGCFLEQTQKLHAAARRAQRQGNSGNANVKLFERLSRLVLEAIPSDPGRAEYRIGNTLGPAHRHWRRAKIGRRFRLFFRYDTKSRVIIYAWVNDRDTQPGLFTTRPSRGVARSCGCGVSRPSKPEA